MNNRTLNIGLIGAGAVVRTLHAPLLRQFSDVSLAWVCDAKIDAARSVAEAFGVPAATDDLAKCADVDAVLLAIPVGVRSRAWQAAADRGWHVLCEKPAAATRAEFDAFLSAMQRRGRVVHFGLMRRFYDGVMCLKDIVSRRVFGDPLEVFAGEGGPQPRTGRGGDWYQLDRRIAGGGVLIETGSHLLDQVLFAAGACAVQLESYAQRTWQDGPEFDARLAGTLTAVGGRAIPFSAIVTRSSEVCNGLFVRYPEIVLGLPPGPGASVELREPSGRLVARIEGTAGGAKTSFQAFRDQWRHFLTACRDVGAADPVGENRLTRLSVGLIEDCYSS